MVWVGVGMAIDMDTKCIRLFTCQPCGCHTDKGEV